LNCLAKVANSEGPGIVRGFLWLQWRLVETALMSQLGPSRLMHRSKHRYSVTSLARDRLFSGVVYLAYNFTDSVRLLVINPVRGVLRLTDSP
jgi:hypothetical protein